MTENETKQQALLANEDLITVRQLYVEAQNWARHYEQLIVNANVLVVSAALIFVGLSFGENISRLQAMMVLVVPNLMSIAGILLTETLFNLYSNCIARLIRLETLLGCYDPARFNSIDGKGSLLPAALSAIPIIRPTSVRFFMGLHILLIASYSSLIFARW